MLVTIREHEYLHSIEKSNWKIDSLTSSIGWLLSIIAFYSSVAAADNHDEEEIVLPFLNEVITATVEQICGVLARRKAVEDSVLAFTDLILVGHGDNSCSFFLFQVGNEIPQRPRLDVRA